ncbi:hypothetical protein MAMMFC1_00222 [Methylomusa anaerophila]|uniref:Uncharacterized protein n=1 Tax=Methylomusa anaerophila TaxID=1930071 RepID=A0A348AEU1_9FIRM|nr:hypothetical protein MAMMFC1_00222 [Methylomusa anaerophila]
MTNNKWLAKHVELQPVIICDFGVVSLNARNLIVLCIDYY